MGKLIVAPVGEQAAAVLAPLAASNLLRVRPDDRVMLIASHQTSAAARQVELEIRREVHGLDLRLVEASPAGLDEALLTSLASEARGTETVVLANGGPTAWIHGLVRALADLPSCSFAASRDRAGMVLDGQGGIKARFTVENLGLSRLLDFLSLRRVPDGLVTTDGATWGEIVELEECAGQLYAARRVTALDRRLLPGTYRRELLDWARLHRFGLELRRMLLVDPADSLARRSRGDGLLSTHDIDLAGWLGCVRDGTASSLVEWSHRRRLDDQPSEVSDGPARWSGPALLVTVGSQAGTSLQAVWAHEPRQLGLVYDPESPASKALANTIRMSADHGAARVHCFQLRHPLSIPDNWPPEGAPLAVNTTPGDKRATLALELWAHHHTPRAGVWFLDRGKARPADDVSALSIGSASVPVALRFAAYAPGQTDSIPIGPNPELEELARDMIGYLADPATRTTALGRLFQKGRPDKIHYDVASGVLEAPRKENGAWIRRPVQIDRIHPELPPAFAPKERGEANGTWWEWMVAARLRALGIDEVVLGARVFWPGDSATAGRGHRDELDVLSRRGATYTYWSCKAYLASIPEELAEARAQATKLLGRETLAVLVVPRLPEPRDDSRLKLKDFTSRLTHRTSDHWAHPTLGHVVGAAFFAGGRRARARVQSLAGGGWVAPAERRGVPAGAA